MPGSVASGTTYIFTQCHSTRNVSIWVSIMHFKSCILKKGPDGDLKTVETCHPRKYNNINKERLFLTVIILIFINVNLHDILLVLWHVELVFQGNREQLMWLINTQITQFVRILWFSLMCSYFSVL